MTKNLTRGNPMRLILSFGIPILFGYLFQQLYKPWAARPWPPWAPPAR